MEKAQMFGGDEMYLQFILNHANVIRVLNYWLMSSIREQRKIWLYEPLSYKVYSNKKKKNTENKIQTHFPNSPH